MIRRRKLLVLVVVIILIFLITTNYLLLNLQISDSEVRKSSIEKKIYFELENLPEYYRLRPSKTISPIDIFLVNTKNTSFNFKDTNFESLWEEANSWVSKTRIVDFRSKQIGNILLALKHAKITKADLDTRGTQLKLLLTLQGNQQVVFKPKWYDIDKIIDGPVYAGKDRYGSEILGFYLSIVLDKPFTPLSVERTISIKNDILPVATKRLLDTYFKKDNKSCVYGKCFFCKKEDALCEMTNSLTTGALIFNIKSRLINHRSPWQRTYKKGKNAIWQEFPETYCRMLRERLSKKRLYDLIDLSIFDFLIQNGDRHHYETFGDIVIWLDNGKGLGNPFIHHLDILAPLYQCCILRRETLKTLLNLTGGHLKEKVASIMDISNFVTNDHLDALEKRLFIVFATIEYCKKLKRAESTSI